jgi:hypothetical protein
MVCYHVSKSNQIIRPSVKQSSSSKLGMSGDLVDKCLVYFLSLFAIGNFAQSYISDTTAMGPY